MFKEIHEGLVRQHLIGDALSKTTFRVNYFCPTMRDDAK